MLRSKKSQSYSPRLSSLFRHPRTSVSVFQEPGPVRFYRLVTHHINTLGNKKQTRIHLADTAPVAVLAGAGAVVGLAAGNRLCRRHSDVPKGQA